jgi:hypothetical protein
MNSHTRQDSPKSSNSNSNSKKNKQNLFHHSADAKSSSSAASFAIQDAAESSPLVPESTWSPTTGRGSNHLHHDDNNKEVQLRLPTFTDLYKTESLRSASTGTGSQFYHSAHSEAASDDEYYYMSEDSNDLSSFNVAKPTLVDLGSELSF